MGYCDKKPGATVRYKFDNGPEKVYRTGSTPIDISVEEVDREVNAISRNSFDGSKVTTYTFSVSAPVKVPADAKIWLLSASWDDNGTIGSYSSPSGDVVSFPGPARIIGTGQQVQGTARNTHPTVCYANADLSWRFKGHRIVVKNAKGAVVFTDTGNKNCTFQVECFKECPPGHIKCSKVTYPGYCCHPCAPIATALKALIKSAT